MAKFQTICVLTALFGLISCQGVSVQGNSQQDGLNPGLPALGENTQTGLGALDNKVGQQFDQGDRSSLKLPSLDGLSEPAMESFLPPLGKSGQSDPSNSKFGLKAANAVQSQDLQTQTRTDEGSFGSRSSGSYNNGRLAQAMPRLDSQQAGQVASNPDAASRINSVYLAPLTGERSQGYANAGQPVLNEGRVANNGQAFDQTKVASPVQQLQPGVNVPGRLEAVRMPESNGQMGYLPKLTDAGPNAGLTGQDREPQRDASLGGPGLSQQGKFVLSPAADNSVRPQSYLPAQGSSGSLSGALPSNTKLEPRLPVLDNSNRGPYLPALGDASQGSKLQPDSFGVGSNFPAQARQGTGAETSLLEKEQWKPLPALAPNGGLLNTGEGSSGLSQGTATGLDPRLLSPNSYPGPAAGSVSGFGPNNPGSVGNGMPQDLTLKTGQAILPSPVRSDSPSQLSSGTGGGTYSGLPEINGNAGGLGNGMNAPSDMLSRVDPRQDSSSSATSTTTDQLMRAFEKDEEDAQENDNRLEDVTDDDTWNDGSMEEDEEEENEGVMDVNDMGWEENVEEEEEDEDEFEAEEDEETDFEDEEDDVIDERDFEEDEEEDFEEDDEENFEEDEEENFEEDEEENFEEDEEEDFEEDEEENLEDVTIDETEEEEEEEDDKFFNNGEEEEEVLDEEDFDVVDEEDEDEDDDDDDNFFNAQEDMEEDSEEAGDAGLINAFGEGEESDSGTAPTGQSHADSEEDERADSAYDDSEDLASRDEQLLEGTVDQELANRNRPPTGPSSMVLFYTWMIVAILLVVVAISTYQARFRGIKFPFVKYRQPTREDKKRLLDHEYV